MARPTTDFTETDLARLRLLGRRLSGELAALIEAAPDAARTARGLAKFLGIDRGTAQRALVASRLSHEPLQALARGPGVAALRQIVRGVLDAPAQTSLGEDSVRGLAAAADQIESTLRELGISQAALVRMMEPAPEEPASAGWAASTSPDPVDARRRLFEAASECVGRAMDTRAIIMIVRPKPADASKVEIFGGHAVIGYRARPDAMPLVLGRSVDSTAATDQPAPRAPNDPSSPPPSPAPLQLSGERVLMDFCTQPLALVTSRQRGRELFAVVEPRGIEESVDVVLASKGPDDDENSKHLGRVHETRFNIRVPTRAAVFDVYLERSLAQNCVPSLDLFLWPREAHSLRPSNWYDALPGAPLLAVLGQGTRNAASEFYPRHAELTSTLFEASGWNADHFVGFRCQTAYPHWASCYTVNFDYRAQASEE